MEKERKDREETLLAVSPLDGLQRIPSGCIHYCEWVKCSPEIRRWETDQGQILFCQGGTRRWKIDDQFATH
jgi:hypothetical protein